MRSRFSAYGAPLQGEPSAIRRLLLASALVMGALTLASLSALAQTNVTATSTGAGYWSAPSTWNCGAPINGGCVPSNGTPANYFYEVTIDTGAPPTGINLDTSRTIDTLALDSGTGFVTGSAVTLTIGSSNNVGSLTNAGLFALTTAGSTINVGLPSNPNATVTNSDDIITGCSDCGGSNLFQVYGNLRNSGSVYAGSFGGGGNLFNVTGAFTNASGAFFLV